MTNETILIMAKQINVKELSFAKFKIMADKDKNQLTVRRGTKFIEITYTSNDLYNIQKGKIRKFEVTREEIQKGYYEDMLKPLIEEYFKFEYVMDSIMGVN